MDRVGAKIVIFGTLTSADAAARVAEAIEADNVSHDWGDARLDRYEALEMLVEAADQGVSGYEEMTLYDDQSRDGTFPTIEAAVVQAGLGYLVIQERTRDADAMARTRAPGWPEERQVGLAEGEEPVMEVASVLTLLEDGDVEGLMKLARELSSAAAPGVGTRLTAAPGVLDAIRERLSGPRP